MTIVPEWLADHATKPSISCFYNDADTDNDGIKCTNNDGKKADTDGDTIEDGKEDTNRNGKIDGDNGDGKYSPTECWEETDPNNIDTDNDNINDGDELEWGYNPRSNDTDSDGLNDNIEDANCDGILDEDETDPREMDTDGDGLTDPQEIQGWTVVITYEATQEVVERRDVTSDPRLIDSDSDGMTDYEEFTNNTDPTEADSDGDGKTDIEELTQNLGSRPTGIDGKAPEIWKFECDYVADYEKFLFIDLPSGLKVSVSVGARDLFGIRYIAISISGLPDIKQYFDNVTNISKKFEWTINGIDQYERALFKGFKINLTAMDRNGNRGYKNDELKSISEIVVSAFLGPLLSAIKFLVELTSLIFKWIFNFINDLINIPLNIVKNSIKSIGIALNEYLNIIIIAPEKTKANALSPQITPSLDKAIEIVQIIMTGLIMLQVAITALIIIENVLKIISGGSSQSITFIVTPAEYVYLIIIGALMGMATFATEFVIFGILKPDAISDFFNFIEFYNDYTELILTIVTLITNILVSFFISAIWISSITYNIFTLLLISISKIFSITGWALVVINIFEVALILLDIFGPVPKKIAEHALYPFIDFIGKLISPFTILSFLISIEMDRLDGKYIKCRNDLGLPSEL